MDLFPAKWIWLPSERTVANTFVLFRREIELKTKPQSAKGWIVADSRYRLTVNGERIQWGPAPSDPRHLEVDPLDITEHLRKGKNIIGVEVLFYGHGEGTWPCGKPGLLLSLEIDDRKIVSDKSWLCALDPCHRPGQYKRSYLRALQEEFDANGSAKRRSEWMPSMEFDARPDRSAIASSYSHYQDEIWMQHPETSTLAPRSIPLMVEEWIEPALYEVGEIEWKRDPGDWFDFRIPDSFGEFKSIDVEIIVGEGPNGADHLHVLPKATPGHGRTITFEWPHGIVGWPHFWIEAPAGTVVEMIVQESVAPGQHWLDTGRSSWSRFTCGGGAELLEPFDYEAFKFVQLHIHGTDEPVTIANPRARQRKNAWPHEAQVKTDDPILQKLFDAAINTLDNCAQDICVDGMGRERQQYSGDCSHQLHAVRSIYGSVDVSTRFLKTFAYGQNLEGYWFDSWPAFDRMDRLWQRQLGLSEWGPLLDHSIGFCFDHYHHWMQTGDLETTREHWSRLMKFVDYLRTQMTADAEGLMPVSDIGVPAVWMDHLAYENQDQKRLAYNLYAGAMLRSALLPLGQALGRTSDAERVGDMGSALVAACVRHYWDAGSRLFVNNLGMGLPPRVDDRSLAMAVLYDLCPDGDDSAVVEALIPPPLREGREVERLPSNSGQQADTPLSRPSSEGIPDYPPSKGESYPANAVWRHWALAKAGRMDVVFQEFREKWARMYSVERNGTIQEFWDEKPGEQGLMSHCAVSPLILLHQGVLGLRPLKPGYRKLEIRPQFAGLPSIETTAHVPQGAIHLKAEREGNRHRATILVPTGVEAYLVLPAGTKPIANGKPLEFEILS